MDEKTRELVGIVASVTGHCRPCFQYHFKQAEKLGVPIEDITEVIELARNISTAGDKGMYEFISKQLKEKKEVEK
jgi:AhpD family alkylhydroperoxidase